jgi:hypothetical protein
MKAAKNSTEDYVYLGKAEKELELADSRSCNLKVGVSSTANKVARITGTPGKADDIDGGDVEQYFLDGKIKESADCYETDIVNTLGVWCATSCFLGD